MPGRHRAKRKYPRALIVWLTLWAALCATALILNTLPHHPAPASHSSSAHPVVPSAPFFPAPVPPHPPPPVKPPVYVVRAGDSLWAIGLARCGNGLAWHQLYAVNRRVIGADPNEIASRMRLALACGPYHLAPKRE